MRRLLWILLAFLVFMVAFSQAMGWWWGRDKSELAYTSEAYQFSANRDKVSGVWDFKAPNQNSLWFAFGYLQSFDREFQSELIRMAARGEASRLFGEPMLKNDRLMRFSRRAAEDEFQRSPDFVKAAAEAFVAGREAALKNPDHREPIEYQIMGITRASLPPWEASDVVAIARFHAWQLSFDVSLEQLYVKLSKKLGPEKARMLLPSEPVKSQALYSQPRLYEGVRREDVLRRNTTSPGLARPEAFYPSVSTTQIIDSNNLRDELLPALPSVVDFGKSLAYDAGTQLALRGASNLWVLADPRVGRALTLCNDTHLRFTWPSSLYPIRWTLEAGTRGTGFMLPGVPAMVVGSVESLGADKEGSAISWGITLASYGDTQDLVLVEASLEPRFVKRQESYPIRDLQTGQIEVRRLEEIWTPHGPRVDTIFADEAEGLGRPLSLDWLGFGKTPSPLEFFVRRNLHGSDGIVADLHERLSYPSFNFTWVERDKGQLPKIGHLVTGWMRSRENRAQDGLEPLRSEELPKRRREIQPKDREYFLRDYDARLPFFLATANQRIWEGNAGLGMAHSWEPDDRARAIVASFDQNVREPTFSQNDSRSPNLTSFLKIERRRNSADRLCSDAPLRSSQCLDLISKLDAWDGQNLVDAWQPTLAALWHAYVKQEIFMALVPEKLRPDLKAAVKDWHRRAFSSGVLARLLTEPDTQARWEKMSEQKLNTLSLEAFRKALRTIVEERGPDPRAWSWGNFHRIDWLHPLVQAPEPWGTVFHDSLLGPRPAVPGALDSPGRFEYSWDEDKPLEFPASHGASLRMCTEFATDGELKMRWSAPTGPSGNPFSRHSKSWSFDTFFKGLLSEVP